MMTAALPLNLHDLGPDNLSTILEYVHDVTSSKGAFRQLCLIDRTLSPLAQAILFRHLYFRIHNSAVLNPNSQVCRLVRTLQNNKALANFVHTVTLTVPANKQGRDLQYMCYILAVCRPRAVHLDVNCGLYPQFLGVADFSRLTRLRLRGPSCDGQVGHEELVNYVAAASQHLEILGLDIMDYDGPGSPTSIFLAKNPILPLELPRLRRLEVVCHMIASHLQLVSLYVGASQRPVESMTLALGAESDNQIRHLSSFLARWWVNLRELDITVIGPSWGKFPFELGKCCPNLWKLSLDGNTYALASFAPPSLRQLHFKDTITRNGPLGFTTPLRAVVQHLCSILQAPKSLAGLEYLVLEEDNLYPESTLSRLQDICSRRGWKAILPVPRIFATSPSAAFGNLISARGIRRGM